MPRNSFMVPVRRPTTTPLSVRALGRSPAAAVGAVLIATTQRVAATNKSLSLTPPRWCFFASMFFMADSFRNGIFS
jgi:hypothetical protein